MLASFARGDRQRRDVGGVREGLSWRCCIERPPPPHPYRPHWMNSQMGGEHLALLIVCSVLLTNLLVLLWKIFFAIYATIIDYY